MSIDPKEAIESLTDPYDKLYFDLANNPSMQAPTGGKYHVELVIEQVYVLQER